MNREEIRAKPSTSTLPADAPDQCSTAGEDVDLLGGLSSEELEHLGKIVVRTKAASTLARGPLLD